MAADTPCPQTACCGVGTFKNVRPHTRSFNQGAVSPSLEGVGECLHSRLLWHRGAGWVRGGAHEHTIHSAGVLRRVGIVVATGLEPQPDRPRSALRSLKSAVRPRGYSSGSDRSVPERKKLAAKTVLRHTRAHTRQLSRVLRVRPLMMRGACSVDVLSSTAPVRAVNVLVDRWNAGRVVAWTSGGGPAATGATAVHDRVENLFNKPSVTLLFARRGLLCGLSPPCPQSCGRRRCDTRGCPRAHRAGPRRPRRRCAP